MLHLISMKIFEGHLGINWSTEKNLMKSSVMWFSSHIVFCFFKTSKIFFSETDEQIEVKPYKYDRLSMRKKTFTHMMS